MVRWLRQYAIGRILFNLLGRTRSEIRRHGALGFLHRIPGYLRYFRAYWKLLASAAPASNPDLFSKPAPVPRNIRLHPELSGAVEPIDASISVIIPTLNAGREFPWLLRKLLEQQGIARIEVIIVDSGSTDGTPEYAREMSCHVLEITPAEFSHSHARNIGATAATGDFLLFMVQDAYPIGTYWTYGMLRFLLDHADQKLAALSCAEFPRTDSDLFYDSIIAMHYRFLGCHEYDRIGEYGGEDYMSLRASAQLSDVACMIRRELFENYRYRGDYAEDLDLGIRLIKDGYRVAMLASVKVIHSHLRPPYYYLKRSFVDVVFLDNLFKDYAYPRIVSVQGLVVGMLSVAAHISLWLAHTNTFPEEKHVVAVIDEAINDWRKNFGRLLWKESIHLGDENLDTYLETLRQRHLPEGKELDLISRDEARRFKDGFLARLEYFSRFVAEVYEQQDDCVHAEVRNAICKIFASCAGCSLGYMYLDRRTPGSPEHAMAEMIKNELQTGI